MTETSPPPGRVRAPARPQAPAPTRPPFVAAAAPLLMSGAMFALTHSPFALVLAAVSPLVLLGSFVDGRLVRRRRLRSEAERFARELREAQDEVSSAHERERAARDRQSPAGSVLARESPQWSGAPPTALVVGRGTSRSTVSVEGADAGRGVDDGSGALRALAAEATVLPDAPSTIEAGDVLVVGSGASAVALARSLTVQLAARLPPGRWRAGCAEDWLALAGYRPTTLEPGEWARFEDDEAVLRVGCATQAAPGRFRTTLTVRAGHALVAGERVEVDLVPRVLAAGWARRAGAAAGAAGASGGLPDRVALAELSRPATARADGLAAPLGRDAGGTVTVDLVADGPHAFVAGTTGSGKSELLATWLLGLVADRGPGQVTLLLLDFKGGTTFRPFVRLPPVVGLVTDLDPPAALVRAVDGIAAELRRRERALAETGLRSIDEPGHDLPRLVVIVDEYAALVASAPALQAVFAEVAARGRALGVHLVLATQRPGGVVRDAVLANVGLRLCLRVTNRADSVAVISSDEAAVAAVPGRAWLAVAGRVSGFQSAIAPAEEPARRADDLAGTVPAPRLWCDPLPATVSAASLPPGAFGLLDRPAEQQQPPATADGSVLVIGAAGSGRTSALAALAADAEVTRVPADDPETAWELLCSLAAAPGVGTVVVDDLDTLLAAVPPDYERPLQQLLAGLLRGGPGGRRRVLASARRVDGPLHPVAALVPDRLVLRAASRQEHLLGGADPAHYDPAAPPGRGLWRGEPVQVVADRGLRARPLPGPARLEPGPGLLVATGPGVRAEPLLGDAWCGIGPVGQDLPAHVPVVGAVEEWQAHWAAMPALLRERPLLLLGCSPADVRSLTRLRELPPLLLPGSGNAWLLPPGGRIRRVAPERGGGVESAPEPAPDY